MYTNKYKKLLEKYCYDTDIFELIEQCILDEAGCREAEFVRSGRYPERRELIMKLKYDLISCQNFKTKGGE